MRKVNNLMRERRIDIGIGLNDIMRVTGVSGKVLFMIENDPDYKPNHKYKVLVCKALGTTVEEIFGD